MNYVHVNAKFFTRNTIYKDLHIPP